MELGHALDDLLTVHKIDIILLVDLTAYIQIHCFYQFELPLMWTVMFAGFLLLLLLLFLVVFFFCTKGICKISLSLYKIYLVA